MKYITKTGAPRDYLDWYKAIKGSPNEDYRNLQNPEKANLHAALLHEQGWLCAYTMRRIAAESSHIEHIKPETLCRSELKGSDLDYQNLVACYPRDGMTNPYRYGAQEKGDWWENNGKDFVSPLSNQCEAKFSFNLRGEITTVNNDVAAKKTIEVLNLKHPSLTEDRMRAIKAFIFGSDGKSPLSPKQAEQAKERICQANHKGEFVEFCVAIRHALVEYIRNLEKAAQKRKHIQTQQNKKK